MTEDKLVTLIDGRQVSYRSEEWRAECEARHVARIPFRDERHGYLDGVEKNRGKEARVALQKLAEKIFYAELAAKKAASAAKEHQ